jgi:general secretion pathway protein G
MRRTDRVRSGGESGFTLVELMIVMTIIGILSAIAIPSFIQSVKKAKEAALKEDLHTMRTAIDSYTIDKQAAPQALDDLVRAGYLRTVPMDPMTSRTDTWITSESDTMSDLSQTQGGMDDVHSGSQAVSSEGTTYNTW